MPYLSNEIGIESQIRQYFMKVVRWVYNTLNKFVRRVKRIMMTSLTIAIGTMMIPVGLFMIITAKLSPNSPQTLYVLGLVVGGIGIISLIRAMIQANRDDEKMTRGREALISEIKGLREDLWNKRG